MSFFIDEYDAEFYYDLGNEDDMASEVHYIPHGMVFGRKQNRIFQAISGTEIALRWRHNQCLSSSVCSGHSKWITC